MKTAGKRGGDVYELIGANGDAKEGVGAHLWGWERGAKAGTVGALGLGRTC